MRPMLPPLQALKVTFQNTQRVSLKENKKPSGKRRELVIGGVKVRRWAGDMGGLSRTMREF